MSIAHTARLYVDTVRQTKPSQLWWRVWRKLGGKVRLKPHLFPSFDCSITNIDAIPTMPELDFDSAFLARFDCDAIMHDNLELLHHSESIDWTTCWREQNNTPLWRFNLHYHEYILALGWKSIETRNPAYILKASDIIQSWIRENPREIGGDGWHPYTIAIRSTVWIAFLSEFKEPISAIPNLTEAMSASLAEQYNYLASHLEKDLLANHYLEDLKALSLLASFFCDDAYFENVVAELEKQIAEQILPDGIHFELSPMYHKIALEDLLRVATVLKAKKFVNDPAGFCRIQDMCDCLYSMERDANRTPLFNDSGDNVAKSRDALLTCARRVFRIEPKYKPSLPNSGFYFLERKTESGMIKAVFKSGELGPSHAMGHAHCDALSIEVFIDGNPWVVNFGTYAYQDSSRLMRKSTRSHNAPVLTNMEQAECWASFRVARRGRATLNECQKTYASGIFTYPDGRRIYRRVDLLEDRLRIEEKAENDETIETVIRLSDEYSAPDGFMLEKGYSPEFGSECECYVSSRKGKGPLVIELFYPHKKELM